MNVSIRLLGKNKSVIGALGVGLAIYIIGSVVTIVLNSEKLNRLYADYMGIIWIVLSALVYPVVKRLLKEDGGDNST